MGVREKGTVMGRVGGDLDADWATNDKKYRIAPVSVKGITLSVVKNADRTLDVTLTGALNQEFTFRVSPIPDTGPQGLHVGLTWGDGQVKLYLSGKLVDTADA